MFEFLEGLAPGDVVHNHNALCAFVVGAGDCAEPLLARGVPNLKLYYLPVDVDRPASGGAYLNRKSTPMVAK